MFTVEKFIKGLQSLINLTTEIQGEILIISREYVDFEDGEETARTREVGRICLSELSAVAKSLMSSFSYNNKYNEFMLLGNVTYEAAVQSYDRMRPFFKDRTIGAFSEHNYEFKISNASNEYVFALFCFCSEHPNVNFEFRLGYKDKITTLEEFLSLFRISTGKINAAKTHSALEYKTMFQSYLFNLSYVNNIALSTVDFTENRRSLKKSPRRKGQLFPFKSYNKELIKYYHQALSTDIYFAQYLAFYHVAEFFFQSLSEKDTFNDISDFITRPSFSPYKEENIRQFYNMLKKKMKEQKEDGVWNEKTSLLLCLKEFIPNFEVLKNTIETIDSSAIDYYRNNLVDFADESKKVNFDNSPDQIYFDIRDRVYSVRNAIVHSKECEKLRYEPFKNDKQLAKEIPLIRAIAEEIILNAAELIKWDFDN